MNVPFLLSPGRILPKKWVLFPSNKRKSWCFSYNSFSSEVCPPPPVHREREVGTADVLTWVRTTSVVRSPKAIFEL